MHIISKKDVQTHEEATVYVKELDIFLTMKVFEDTKQFYRWESFAMNTDTHMNGSTVRNHISLKNGIRIQCNTENFVPIVVPGLSTSFSSSLPSSTSMTPSKQEIDHPTASSNSSTSPTTTSSTVSCDSVT